MAELEPKKEMKSGSSEARRKINKVITGLSRIPGVTGSILVREDGIVISSEVSGGQDQNVVGAMSAAIFEYGNSCMDRINLGEFRSGLVESSSGVLLLLSIDRIILTLLANRTVPIGFLSARMREAAEEIRKLV